MLQSKKQYWEKQAKARDKNNLQKRFLPASNRMPQWASSPNFLWGWAFLHCGSQAKSGKVALLNNATTGQAQSIAEHLCPAFQSLAAAGVLGTRRFPVPCTDF